VGKVITNIFSFIFWYHFLSKSNSFFKFKVLKLMLKWVQAMYLVLILKTIYHLENNLMKLEIKTSMITMLWNFRLTEPLKKLTSLFFWIGLLTTLKICETCFFEWLRVLWNLWFCKLILYFDAKLNITLYYGGYVYIVFIIKSYFALLTYLQYYISLHKSCI